MGCAVERTRESNLRPVLA